MRLAAFNALPEADARIAVEPCLAVPRWVDELVGARPYPAVAELLEYADRSAGRLSPQEVTAALAAHPRIGERASGSTTTAVLSRSEQSGVWPDADVAEALRAGNAAYERRFGRVFLIRAAGRTGEEILGELDRRLGNDPQAELDEVAGQLREIALLRLEQLVRP